MEGGRSPLYAPLLPPPPPPPPPPHLLICPTLPNTMHIAPCPNAALYCVSRLDTLSAPPPPHPFKPASLAQSLWRCKATFRSKHCSCRAILCVPAKDSWKKYVGRPYLPRPTSHCTGLPQLCLLTGPQIVLQYIKRFPIFCFLARHRLVWQDF